MDEKNEFFIYDKVVIATHADEALKIIESPSEDELNILSNFSYKKNYASIDTTLIGIQSIARYKIQIFCNKCLRYKNYSIAITHLGTHCYRVRLVPEECRKSTGDTFLRSSSYSCYKIQTKRVALKCCEGVN